MIGQTIAHHRILGKLGEGGMGVVYRARDSRLGRDVALKLLPDVFAADAERLARFEREAQLLAALNHPNIAAIHGLEEANGLRFLVLELVEGETLAERLARGPLPLEEALELARQVAEGLEAAHEKGIVHRDLKPGNVKLTPDGVVKILDFGLAKAFAAEAAEQDISKSPTLTSPSTQVGVLLGTVAYMSPEQARGKAVDRRADIWAFGCLLYEMLTARAAFAGESVSDVVAAVLKSEPNWSALPAHTPDQLRTLLRRCLQKDPKQRLHHIADARLELAEALAGGGIRVAAALPRLRWPVAAALLLAGIAIGAVLGFLGLMRGRQPAPPAPVRLGLVLPSDAPMAVGAGPAVALSPDGRRLVYVARRGTTTQLYVRALDREEVVPIPGTESASGPFFSPDGEWVGFFAGADFKLKKVPISGGPAVTLCRILPNAIGASWAPDDRIYFYNGRQGGLAQVPASGGAPEVVTVPDTNQGEVSHRWPHVLPGGEAIFFAIETSKTFDDARIGVLSLKTGKWKTLLEGGSLPQYAPSGHLLFVRAGTLLAAPFSLDRLEVTGPPVPVLDGITTDARTGDALVSLSGNGTLVFLPGGLLAAERALVSVDRNGVARPLTDVRPPFEDLDLSPDGRYVATTIEGPAWNVWVYDVVRGTLGRLTFERDNRDPAWTPDGKRIVYASLRDGRYGLYSKAADGSGSEEQLYTSQNWHVPYSFSPDGQILSFSEVSPTTAMDLWLLPLSGERKARVFLQTKFEEESGMFSPDGRWLAYDSDESGRSEIYVQAFPGPGGKWQISTTGGQRPVWAATGSELYYRNGDKLMAVTVTAQPSFNAGTPRVLFQGHYWSSGHAYDVSPDGQHFVMIKAGEQESSVTHLGVVLNWSEDLRRVVPRQ